MSRELKDILVSAVWILILFGIFIWSLWIVFVDQFNPPVAQAVKKANEYKVERFLVKRFLVDDSVQFARGSSFYYDPKENRFLIDNLVADSSLYSKARKQTSQVFVKTKKATVSFFNKPTQVIELAQPFVKQAFPDQIATLEANQGILKHHFLFASGDVSFKDEQHRVNAQQLKYDFSRGQIDLSGSEGKRVSVEF